MCETWRNRTHVVSLYEQMGKTSIHTGTLTPVTLQLSVLDTVKVQCRNSRSRSKCCRKRTDFLSLLLFGWSNPLTFDYKCFVSILRDYTLRINIKKITPTISLICTIRYFSGIVFRMPYTCIPDRFRHGYRVLRCPQVVYGETYVRIFYCNFNTKD